MVKNNSKCAAIRSAIGWQAEIVGYLQPFLHVLIGTGRNPRKRWPPPLVHIDLLLRPRLIVLSNADSRNAQDTNGEAKPREIFTDG